jgi:hypothetical protein
LAFPVPVAVCATADSGARRMPTTARNRVVFMGLWPYGSGGTAWKGRLLREVALPQQPIRARRLAVVWTVTEASGPARSQGAVTAPPNPVPVAEPLAEAPEMPAPAAKEPTLEVDEALPVPVPVPAPKNKDPPGVTCTPTTPPVPEPEPEPDVGGRGTRCGKAERAGQGLARRGARAAAAELDAGRQEPESRVQAGPRLPKASSAWKFSP